MIRNIIRPANIATTPKLLKEALGAERTRKYPSDRPDTFRKRFYDWDADLFTIYPPPDLVHARDKDEYTALYNFFHTIKPRQRELLTGLGVQTIPCITLHSEAARLVQARYVEEDKYIVRPYRHSGGEEYKVTINPIDFKEGREYCSVFFPKRREYRVIFIKGKPVITLRKRVPEGVDNLAPWNHATGSVFVTVEHDENNHLLKTSVMEDLMACPIITTAHVVGVDILLSKGSKKYAVVEVNSCPAMTLEHNLEKVKQSLDVQN